MKINCPECDEKIEPIDISIFDEPNQYIIIIYCNRCNKEFQTNIDFNDLYWDEC